MRTPYAARPGGTQRALRPFWSGLLSVLVCLFAQPVSAADTPEIMVIFDGSGSMWGKPPGERLPKLVLARDALRQSLHRIAKPTRVGLMVFGRRVGDCSDVELVARPEPVDVDRIAGALERLNPKGKGPLTLAVGEAARILGAATTPASIVLIHDDSDNCAPDPCAGINEIAKIYPKLTVHPVSIGVLPEDSERIACFAQATGGRVHEARSPAAIATAIDEALQAASRPPGTVVPQPRLVSRDAATLPSVPSAKPGVFLSASLAAGAEPLDIPVRWRVTRVTDPDGPAVYQEEAVAPRIALSPGTYEIEARLSQITVSQTVDVDPAAAQRVHLTLNAGTIRLTIGAQGNTAPASGVVVTISKPKSEAGNAVTGRPGEPVLVSNAGQSEIALEPGPYVITISHGLFRTDRQIMVVAGTRGRLAIPLPTGELELQAAAVAGGPPLTDVIFQVFEDDPDAPQGRRELVRSAATRPSFTLPAGTYYVVARRGTTEVRERITVRAGHVERRTVNVVSAQLSLAATMAGGRPDTSDSILYRVEAVDGAGEVARLTRQTGTLDLAPGRYRVESRLGTLNARAERIVDLKAGAREELTMDHRAGVVRLALVEAGSTQPAADVFWEIKDQGGQSVWLSSEPQPLGVLNAGRYLVRAEHRDRRVERQIDVQPGDNRVVELIAK